LSRDSISWSLTAACSRLASQLVSWVVTKLESIGQDRPCTDEAVDFTPFPLEYQDVLTVLTTHWVNMAPAPSSPAIPTSSIAHSGNASNPINHLHTYAFAEEVGRLQPGPCGRADKTTKGRAATECRRTAKMYYSIVASAR